MNYKEIIISDWEEIYDLEVEWSNCVYRGQSSSEWELEPSLSRLFRAFLQDSEWGWISKEYYLLKSFKRRAHQYEKGLPNLKDTASWLALMQHHGTPTRLLDFTYSFYIAAYFALVGSTEDSVVWAIEDDFLRTYGVGLSGVGNVLREKQLSSIYDYTNDFINEIHKEQKGVIEDYGKEKLGVLMLEPEQQIPRLGIQQGLFLMPMNIHRSFLDNLKGISIEHSNDDNMRSIKDLVTRIVLKKEMKETAVAHLNKMNITSETLFPGFDGFARSLTQVELYI